MNNPHLTKLKAECEAALALADKATPGPWRYRPLILGDGSIGIVGIVGNDKYDVCEFDGSDETIPGDGKFVAQSRTLVPHLAQECLRLMKALEVAVGQRYYWQGFHVDMVGYDEKFDNKVIADILEGKS